MALVEPVPGEAAATATLDDQRFLLIADYHAGYEVALRYERGVEVPSRAVDRRERLLDCIERTAPQRLVVLGDLMHSIGDPSRAERGELEVLFEELPSDVGVTLVKGNHDGAIQDWLADAAGASGTPEAPISTSRLEIVDGAGIAMNGLGVCHGHTWPAVAALGADVLCLGHEHPCVRLVDEVGGSRIERVWLRGRCARSPFRAQGGYAELEWLAETGPDPPQIVVLPAFNDLVGGTWINVPDQSFLAPFLPEGIVEGEAYLLDGTRLGDYQSL